MKQRSASLDFSCEPTLALCSFHIFFLLFFGVLTSARGADVPDNSDTQIERGKSIYRTGMLAPDQPLIAHGRADLALQGSAVACVNCHRRSGLGASEGGTLVLPITGSVLFETQALGNSRQSSAQDSGSNTRPAYTEATLLRALQEGVDSAGRPLDRLMPRYQLTRAEFAPLASYLRTLSTIPTPGVTADEIHLATIIVNGVDPRQRLELLTLLNTFVKDKNSETRQEPRRAKEAVHSRELMYQGYRKWVLHVWDLNGEPASWEAQLNAYYGQQPVFAVLGGLSTGIWSPVHAFCEVREMPCLFPSVDVPVQSETAFYTLYFSRGVALEAEVLAAHLHKHPVTTSGTVLVQVYRNDPYGSAAATAMHTANLDAGMKVIDVAIDPKQTLTKEFWGQILQREKPSALVLWLNASDLSDFPNVEPRSPNIERIYLSGSALRDEVPARWGSHLPSYVIYPYELPSLRPSRFVRMKAWLRSKNIPVSNEILQANTYFTLAVAADALRHLRNNFSREYFLERIESMAETMPLVSGFHNVSLGPGQRYAVKGSYVAKYHPDHGLESDGSEWIVP